MTREADVVRSLVEMADTLVDDYDVVDLLTGVADRCVNLLGVSAAGRRTGSAQPEPAGDDIFGHLGERPVAAERVRPQADERLGDADPLLDRDHAGRVVHH